MQLLAYLNAINLDAKAFAKQLGVHPNTIYSISRTNPATVDFKKDRVDYWVGKGAQLSPTLARLYKNYNAAAPAQPVA